MTSRLTHRWPTGWRSTFVPYASDEATPLGLTISKAGQGVPGTATFMAGRYPACSEHGAMNRVSPEQMWRCLICNIGVELTAHETAHGAPNAA